MSKEINYVKGDATSPSAAGNKIIVHVCNDIGGWGRGFVLALSAKWDAPEQEYRKWCNSRKNFALGEVRFVQVEPDLWVANLIGQRDVKRDAAGLPPVRYEAIAAGLQKVGRFAQEKQASVHMPRIGCGLAGGIWERMELVIVEQLAENGIPVTVYDL